MKKSIKLSALFLLLSASVFAGTTKKEVKAIAANTVQQVSFAGSKDMNLNIHTSAGSTVRIYDEAKNLLVSDRVSSAKAFNLAELESGAYTVTITTGKQEVAKKVVVYEDNNQKGFFIVQ